MARNNATDQPERLRDTWPLRWRDAGLLLACYLGFTAIWWAVGWTIVESGDSGIARADQRLAEWFVEQRTPALDDWSLAGSWLAETIIKIVVTAIICGVLLWVVKRWLEALVVAVPLIIEAMVFISVTWLVERPRPDVEQVDASPVDTGFPSGHAAAAACYAAIVIVVFWHTRKRWIRALAVVFAAAVPIIVGVARMYRGMHYLTDVIAGVLLGAASVVLVTLILCRAEDRRRSRQADDGRADGLDATPDDAPAPDELAPPAV
ncbi:MAG TPA: phosphatase PAP2 family protein, partial [Ilumatobacteraceae bacterium]|nr:phosphatase PAP2 family protein [Ilumatobacteraceae bacterium]